MRQTAYFVTFVTVLCAGALVAPKTLDAVEPGVDIATPRVAIVTANGSTLRFVPALAIMEQGDHVRWVNGGGSHTTTSGSPCVANNLWTSNLNTTTTMFTRQFNDAPNNYPYFCSPHCGLGMTGTIRVTTLIDARLSDVGGATQLDWSGGGGTYRIYRSTSPAFPTANTTVLTGATGTQLLSLLDQNAGVPPVGGAFYYLVMNQF